MRMRKYYVSRNDRARAPPTPPLQSHIDDRRLTTTVMQLLSFAAIFIALWSCISSLRNTRFVVKVPARSTECFYEQTTQADTQVDVLVQVLQGGQLDIGLSIYESEKDERILSALVERDSKPVALNLSTSHHATSYKICFENTFSLLAHRLVQLTIQVHQTRDYMYCERTSAVTDSDLSSSEPNIQSNLSQELISVQHRLAKVAWQLLNITNTLNYLRALDTRHILWAEYHNRRVVMWSILEMVVIVFVTLVQVIAIQSILGRKRT